MDHLKRTLSFPCKPANEALFRVRGDTTNPAAFSADFSLRRAVEPSLNLEDGRIGIVRANIFHCRGCISEHPHQAQNPSSQLWLSWCPMDCFSNLTNSSNSSILSFQLFNVITILRVLLMKQSYSWEMACTGQLLIYFVSNLNPVLLFLLISYAITFDAKKEARAVNKNPKSNRNIKEILRNYNITIPLHFNESSTLWPCTPKTNTAGPLA